jgi:hypothetical protein
MRVRGASPARRYEEDNLSTAVVYESVDPREVAARLEELVRTDVCSPSPLAYSISGVAEHRSAGREIASQFVHAALGGPMLGLLTVDFELPAMRSAWLRVQIGRLGRVSYCGPLTFLASIDRAVPEDVGFEKRKALVVAPRFTGGVTAQQLAAVAGLADRVDRVLIPKIILGSGTLELAPTFRLGPADGRTWLLIRTLPTLKMHLRGSSGSTNAGEFLQIVTQIEVAILG